MSSVLLTDIYLLLLLYTCSVVGHSSYLIATIYLLKWISYNAKFVCIRPLGNIPMSSSLSWVGIFAACNFNATPKTPVLKEWSVISQWNYGEVGESWKGGAFLEELEHWGHTIERDNVTLELSCIIVFWLPFRAFSPFSCSHSQQVLILTPKSISQLYAEAL